MKLTNSNKRLLNNSIIFVIVLLSIVVLYYGIIFLRNLNNQNKLNDTFANHNSNNVPIDSIGAKGNHIQNFLAYVNEQKFCPNIYNSASSFWTRFPEKYGQGLLGKFCCTSCYYLVSKEIYCGKNETGLYTISKLLPNDIINLKKYYASQNGNLDFEFPNEKLVKNIGSNVLKMKFEGKHMPIQIIKSNEELIDHEEEPTIANSLYKHSYEC
jgi:hypothetical protein